MAGITPQNRGNKSATRTGATVSRKLRAMGWNISPAARKYKAEGIFVSAQGDYVSILVDLGNAAKNREIAAQLRAEIEASPWGPAACGGRDDAMNGFSFVRFDYVR